VRVSTNVLTPEGQAGASARCWRATRPTMPSPRASNTAAGRSMSWGTAFDACLQPDQGWRANKIIGASYVRAQEIGPPSAMKLSLPELAASWRPVAGRPAACRGFLLGRSPAHPGWWAASPCMDCSVSIPRRTRLAKKWLQGFGHLAFPRRRCGAGGGAISRSKHSRTADHGYPPPITKQGMDGAAKVVSSSLSQ